MSCTTFAPRIMSLGHVDMGGGFMIRLPYILDRRADCVQTLLSLAQLQQIKGFCTGYEGYTQVYIANQGEETASNICLRALNAVVALALLYLFIHSLHAFQ